MLILKSFKRPKGGGPCPLINNPVKKWLKYLSIFHIILLVMTCVSISFPFIHDLHCSILFNSLANLIASAICSTLMATYYIIVSNKDLGNILLLTNSATNIPPKGAINTNKVDNVNNV
ncbi:uncharacterized protein TA15505 [Theileria annulata]|uniref:Uncharacterized protein n=1 Tax=Theileria annulata TaxID=5874 RepID=Q4UFJ0_THEAN|nr:uncharacterized protein TA15505 [Theileria annulata]CAI74126.1 hypothetical protein, conserved [Theileria annulata]|eukprot:XP_951858.1 hypothetical protein, conserved [Theileria annulata]